MKREIAKSRPESRPRSRQRCNFFLGFMFEPRKSTRTFDRGETDSGSDRDSDETFQISRNLGLEHVEFVCLLDSQLWQEVL
jgi:hypothetical protein